MGENEKALRGGSMKRVWRSKLGIVKKRTFSCDLVLMLLHMVKVWTESRLEELEVMKRLDKGGKQSWF